MSMLRWFVVCLLVFAVPTGGFAMIATYTLDELTIRSEIIAYGMLKEAKDAGKEEDGLKKLENIIEIADVLKGENLKGKTVAIPTITGLEDQPEFAPRVKYLLFLKKIGEGSYETVNFLQGAWPVDPSGMFSGLGLGVTPDQLKRSIEATRGKAPPADEVAPEPEF